MTRLYKALVIMDHYGLGVREGMALAVIHLYVSATARRMSIEIGTSLENALAIVGRLRNKDLLDLAIPELSPHWHRASKRSVEKAWRLKDKVRSELDLFEASGTFPPYMNPVKKKSR